MKTLNCLFFSVSLEYSSNRFDGALTHGNLTETVSLKCDFRENVGNIKISVCTYQI